MSLAQVSLEMALHHQHGRSKPAPQRRRSPASAWCETPCSRCPKKAQSRQCRGTSSANVLIVKSLVPYADGPSPPRISVKHVELPRVCQSSGLPTRTSHGSSVRGLGFLFSFCHRINRDPIPIYLPSDRGVASGKLVEFRSMPFQNVDLVTNDE